MLRWTAASGAAILLAGCAVNPGEIQPGSYAAGPARPVFATQLAGPSTFLAPMPTAVVVLKPDDRNRNRAFCTAVTGRLPTAQQALAGSVVAPNVVLTRWLVQLPGIPADRAGDCDFLVGTYDYARAARLIAAVRTSQGSLAGPGPFLLMVMPDSTGLHVVGLDGSGYAAGNLGLFVDTWGTALRQTQAQLGREPDQPGVVRSVVNLVAAILHTAGRAAAGLIQGAVGSL